jgi:Spy/CpxP family protein refolding chaperone
MKNQLSFLLSLIIIAFTSAASAQQNQGYGMGDRVFPLISRVLTDDQRKSIQQIIVSQRDQIRPLEEKIRSSRQALLDLTVSGNFSEGLATQYAGETARAESDLLVIYAKALSQMQPKLSAQQIAQLKSFQPGRLRGSHSEAAAAPEAPEVHMKLPPPLPRDTNDLPVVN